MNPEILVSIIVPAYNYAHFLPRCLSSVLSQISADCELLVVDDGSADTTDLLLREMMEKDTRLRTIRQENAGAAAARNNGIRQSRGKYLLFLDADDELMPGTLKMACTLLREHPEINVIIGGHLSCDPDGRNRSHLPGKMREAPFDRLEDYLLRKRLSIGHGSLVALKRLFEERPYPENFKKSEDIPVFAYLVTNGRIALTDYLMAKIHKHPTSLRHNKTADTDDYRPFVDEVFRMLPVNYDALKKRYAAQRCLSLFRSALQAGEYPAARSYYQQAISIDFRQALKWSYLSKAIRAWYRHA